MAEPVRIVFLGGLGEIGRNCACVELDGRILIIDCGLMFPDAEMPGVDLVLPDFTWLRRNADKVVGCVLTHGHEDHVGALSYLLADLSFPLYSSALTLGLARNRIEEAGLVDRTSFVAVTDGERRRIGPFDVELIPVTHSVPNGFAVALHTPQGVILHTGDFKLDLSPVDGRLTNLARVGALADGPGIRLLLSDSTNAEEPGHTASESSVGAVLRRLFAAHADRRIITTCFASHIHRIQQIIDAAVASDRTIATLGRSMGKNVALARSLGLLRVPEDALVDIEEIGSLPPEQTCIISTGSQGEAMSALALMAAGESKWLQVGPGDLVILSAHAVPGNESAVAKVIDGLWRRGAEVVHAGVEEVHTSGHAKAGELQTMLAVARPECFIPVHGEFRHLTNHARLAMSMGVAAQNVLLCEDGDVVALSDDGIDFDGEVPSGHCYVDGIVGGVSHGVLRDRRVLAEEGVVVAVVGIDVRTGELLTGPEIITRGWIHAEEAGSLLDDARAAVIANIAEAAEKGAADLESYRRAVRSAVGRLVQERTRRRPMIVPVVMEA
ncbi:MAG: ribonuclease J [Acidimicrobiales bacterium]